MMVPVPLGMLCPEELLYKGASFPFADRVVKAPGDGVTDPICPGAEKVAPFSWAALTAVVHEKPDPLTQFKALDVVEQLGTATAVGAAEEAVEFPTNVLAATADNPDKVIVPHAGGVDAPVDTIVLPDVDPVGESSPIGTVDAENAPQENSRRNADMKFFITIRYIQFQKRSLKRQPRTLCLHN